MLYVVFLIFVGLLALPIALYTQYSLLAGSCAVVLACIAVLCTRAKYDPTGTFSGIVLFLIVGLLATFSVANYIGFLIKFLLAHLMWV